MSHQGQKCSALSRLYVSSSVWKNGFKDKLIKETQRIRVGDPTDFQTFLGPVMYVRYSVLYKSTLHGLTRDLVVDLHSTESLDVLKRPKRPVLRFLLEAHVRRTTTVKSIVNLCNHSGDDSKGYFIQPTILLCKDPKSVTFVEEIFGPVLSVSMALRYDDVCLRVYEGLCV